MNQTNLPISLLQETSKVRMVSGAHCTESLIIWHFYYTVRMLMTNCNWNELLVISMCNLNYIFIFYSFVYFRYVCLTFWSPRGSWPYNTHNAYSTSQRFLRIRPDVGRVWTIFPPTHCTHAYLMFVHHRALVSASVCLCVRSCACVSVRPSACLSVCLLAELFADRRVYAIALVE